MPWLKMAQQYRVYIVKSILTMLDLDLPQPRYHTAIFIETEANGSGYVHYVTGDITSVGGMSYEKQFSGLPEQSDTFHAKDLLGVTDASTYPSLWDDLLQQIPPPPRQKAFNLKTMRTEPFKAENPLIFYEPGKSRRSLVKCTEWTLERAVPALRSAGLIY